MKKSIIIIIVLVIVGLLAWKFGGSQPNVTPEDLSSPTASSAPSTESTKVSDKITAYKNNELGFSIKYPTPWELGTSDFGISLVIPFDGKDKNTIKKLSANVSVAPSKCAFPPVTTVKDRGTLKSGDLTFNTISMSNSVQGVNYFDRMYSLQKDKTCYLFTFSSINLSPASKGYKGSEATQIANNNKALIDSADQAFTEMIKSFKFETGPQGQDEAQVVPAKK